MGIYIFVCRNNKKQYQTNSYDGFHFHSCHNRSIMQRRVNVMFIM